VRREEESAESMAFKSRGFRVAFKKALTYFLTVPKLKGLSPREIIPNVVGIALRSFNRVNSNSGSLGSLSP